MFADSNIYCLCNCLNGAAIFNKLKSLKNQMKNCTIYILLGQVKLTIILGVVLYGLCQYDQMVLDIFNDTIIYIILKNSFVFAYVSIAPTNAPKDIEPEDILDNMSVI